MRYDNIGQDVDLRIEIPTFDLSLDISVPIDKNLTAIIKKIKEVLITQKKLDIENINKTLSKMNLRCPARMNKTWLDHSMPIKSFEALYGLSWSLEFFKKEVQIKVAGEKINFNMDLRQPIEHWLKKIARKYRIFSYQEYGIAAIIPAKKLKELKDEELKTGTLTQKQFWELDYKTAKNRNNSSSKDGGEFSFWLDETRSLTDNKMYMIYRNVELRFQRKIFYSDNLITKHNMQESAIMYEQLRDMVASGHFISLSEEDYHKLLRLAIAIDYYDNISSINVKSIDQLMYVPKDKQVPQKLLMEGIKSIASSGPLLELQFRYLDTVRKTHQWGKDYFIVKEAKDRKQITIEISKEGLKVGISPNTKKNAADSGTLYNFNRIQSFKYTASSVTIKITNGQIMNFLTEEGSQIITDLSLYIDYEKSQNRKPKIVLPTEAKVKKEQISSITFVRNVKQEAPDRMQSSKLNQDATRRRIFALLTRNIKANMLESLYRGLHGRHVSGMLHQDLLYPSIGSDWLKDLQKLMSNIVDCEKFSMESPKDVFMCDSEASFHHKANVYGLDLTKDSLNSFIWKQGPDSSGDDIIKNLFMIEQSINSFVSTGTVADHYNGTDHSESYKKIISYLDFLTPQNGANNKNQELVKKLIEFIDKIDLNTKSESNLIDLKVLHEQQDELLAFLIKIRSDLDAKIKKNPDQKKLLDEIINNIDELVRELSTNQLLVFDSINSHKFTSKVYDLLHSTKSVKSSKKSINELLRNLRDFLQETCIPTSQSYSDIPLRSQISELINDLINSNDLKNFENRAHNIVKILSVDKILITNNLIDKNDKHLLEKLLQSLNEDLEEIRSSSDREKEGVKHAKSSFIANKDLLERSAEIRDVIQCYESLQRTFMLMAECYASIPLSIIPKEYHYMFFEVASHFNQAELNLRSNAYDRSLLNHMGDKDEILHFLQLSIKNSIPVYTECLAHWRTLEPIMKPNNSSITVMMNELTRNLSSQIVFLNKTNIQREGFDPTIVMENILKNHLKSVESKKLSNICHFGGSLDSPIQISQQLLNMFEDLLNDLRRDVPRDETLNDDKPFDFSAQSLSVSSMMLLMKKAMAHQTNEAHLQIMVDAHTKVINALQDLISTNHSKIPLKIDQVVNLEKSLLNFSDKLVYNTQYAKLVDERFESINKILKNNVPPTKNVKDTKAYLNDNLTDISVNFATAMFGHKTVYLEASHILKDQCDALASMAKNLMALECFDGEIKDSYKKLMKMSREYFDTLLLNYRHDKIENHHTLMDYLAKANAECDKLSKLIQEKLSLEPTFVNYQLRDLFRNINLLRHPDESTDLNLIEVYCVAFKKIYDCIDQSKIIISNNGSDKSQMETMSQLMSSLSNILSNLKNQSDRYLSRHQIIVPTDDMTSHRFVNVRRKISEATSNRVKSDAKLEMNRFFDSLEFLMKNVASLSDSSTSHQIHKTSLDIEEALNQLREAFNDREKKNDDDFDILHRSHQLELLIDEQTSHLTKRPCVAEDSPSLSDCYMIDQNFIEMSFTLFDLCQIISSSAAKDRKSETFMNPSQLGEQFRAMADQLALTLRSMNPISNSTQDLMDTIDNQLKPMVIVNNKFKAQLIDEASKGYQNLDHFIESSVTEATNLSLKILAQHKFLINSLDVAESPHSLKPALIIDSIQAITCQLMDFIKIFSSVLTVSDSKETRDINEVLDKLLDDLHAAIDALGHGLTNYDIKSHDYSESIEFLKKSAHNFEMVNNAAKSLLNEFKVLEKTKMIIMDARLRLKDPHEDVETQTKSQIHSKLTQSADDINNLLNDMVINLNCAPSFIKSADSLANIYGHDLINIYEASRVSLINSNLPGFDLDELGQILDNFGHSLCLAFDSKIESSSDANVRATECIQDAQHDYARVVKFIQVLSRTNQMLLDMSINLKDLTDHFSGVISDYKDHYEKETLNADEIKERINELKSELSQYNDMYHKMRDIIVGQKNNGATQSTENLLCEVIDEILDQNAHLEKKIVKFYSIVFNNMGNDADLDFHDYCWKSMLHSFLDSQVIHINNLHSIYSQDDSLDEISNIFDSISNDIEKLEKSLKNIEDEQFSREALLGHILSSFKDLKQDFECGKIKQQNSVTNEKFEECELLPIVALESLVKILKNNDDSSRTIAAANLLLSAFEEYVPTAWSMGFNAENNIKDSLRDNISEILDRIIEILTLGMANHDDIDQNRISQCFETILKVMKAINSTVSVKDVCDEEVERLRREKIEKTNQLVRSVLEKYNAFKFDLENIEIIPEMKEIVELIIQSLEQLYKVLILNSQIIDEMNDESRSGIMSMAAMANMNKILAEIMTIHLDAAEYFIQRLKKSKSLVFDSNLNCILVFVYAAIYKQFIKLKKPEYYAENVAISEKAFKLFEEVESMLKKNPYENYEMTENTAIKDTIRMFHLHSTIGSAQKKMASMRRHK